MLKLLSQKEMEKTLLIGPGGIEMRVFYVVYSYSFHSF